MLLIVSLGANLSFLAFFKYYNFLAENLVRLVGLRPHSFALDIVLPLGISFHTFQSISYVVDVYRGEQTAISNPIDYALFIAFFPQLVAGPIVRAREFFADLYNWRAPSSKEQLHGALQMLLGLTKKMALADQFAQISDVYFRNTGRIRECWPHGRAQSPSQRRFISISRAIAIWPSVWRSCWVFISL